MNIHPIGQPAGKIGLVRDKRSALRLMTTEQLLQLGTCQVAYLKAGVRNGKWFFVVFGADGEPLAAVGAVEAALEMTADYGLALVSVH